MAEPDSTPIESKHQLIEYLEAGCTPASGFRLGAEHEQFVFSSSDLQPATYDDRRPGICGLLQEMSTAGWQPIEEGGRTIALERGGCMITLEPGGQFEFAGAPHTNVHQIFRETFDYQKQLHAVAEQLGLNLLPLGYQPKHPRSAIPWMPKERYRIMRAYMPRRGSRGLEMMQCTSSIQVTADFSSEADMVRKFRVTLALQPLVTALFANSPFAAGGLSGYQSLRHLTWSDTDPDRCGSLPFVFEDGMGFERYVDYMLDVPMYFVYRNGTYIDASGLSFRDFMDGQLRILPGERPLMVDWTNHLSTVFPNVRLKHYLEMRGADAGEPVSRVPGLAALWTGLLYDEETLGVVWERIRTWTHQEREELDRQVAKHGFQTPFRGGTVLELCKWMLELARQGLRRRNIQNDCGQDEAHYLDELQRAVEVGQSYAEVLMQRFERQWQADIDLAVRAMIEEARV